MADREKVIKRFSYYCDLAEGKHVRWVFVHADVLRDARDLLKALEPRVMTLEEAQTADICWLEIPTDRDYVIPARTAYRYLGIRYNTTELEVFGTETIEELRDDRYGKTWRCWTSRPTDEQREATPWQI